MSYNYNNNAEDIHMQGLMKLLGEKESLRGDTQTQNSVVSTTVEINYKKVMYVKYWQLVQINSGRWYNCYCYCFMY